MNLTFKQERAEGYEAFSQIARVLTEGWVEDNLFCPRCGHSRIRHLKANTPVGDFYCEKCGSQFELKSAFRKFGKKISDGAYDTMIQRITSRENPDFLFMNYSRQGTDNVKNLFFVPKHFFVPGIIEKRPPLAVTAQRAGWVGCNILLQQIPAQGLIYIIKDGRETAAEQVVSRVQKSMLLLKRDVQAQGWLLDILWCVNQMPQDTFTLADMYQWEGILAARHPQNHTIQPKIRQQLQILRDKGFLVFLGNGQYRRTEETT